MWSEVLKRDGLEWAGAVKERYSRTERLKIKVVNRILKPGQECRHGLMVNVRLAGDDSLLLNFLSRRKLEVTREVWDADDAIRHHPE